MRKIISILILSLFSYALKAQITFKKGYFIDNDGLRIDCLIKDEGWKNTPEEFEYKLDDTGNTQQINIQGAKEFGIDGQFKYIRALTNIDKSPDKTGSLTYGKEPKYVEELLFLEVIIEGKASLYEYRNPLFVRYFYSDQEQTLQPLVYRKYKTNDITKNGVNSKYKRQLAYSLKCESISMGVFESLNYSKGSLKSVFNKYHNCVGSESKEYKPKSDLPFYKLNLRAGLNLSSFKMTGGLHPETDFGTKMSLRLGLENEICLPFNHGKWTIPVEISYQSYEESAIRGTDLQPISVKLDYRSINASLGPRYYIFLKDDSKLFINAGVTMPISHTNSVLHYDTRPDVKVAPMANFYVGAGYKYKDRISVELRYESPKDLIDQDVPIDGVFSTTTVTFGYSIFQL